MKCTFCCLSDFRLNDQMEQRVAVEFCVRLGKSAAEALATAMLGMANVSVVDFLKIYAIRKRHCHQLISTNLAPTRATLVTVQ